MKSYVNRFSLYILLILIILIGYFPIAFQLLSLKNDIIQLDLPVKYFISKELRRGELPIWMYSWGGGFPLGHIFTWGAYNPISLLFGSLFQYNLSTLHLEFMFYIFFGAAGIWKISRRILGLSYAECLITAVTYALSGVTLSCSQFLAYIASIGILPWVYYSFIRLLQRPSLYTSLVFSFCAYLLISWTYPAATIICFYSLLILTGIYYYLFDKTSINKRSIAFLFLSSVLILLLSLPLIYTTFKTLPLFSRSEQLSGGDNNFGYLDPLSLFSFFFPFLNVDKHYTDTTFLFQNVFIGSLGAGLFIGILINYRSLAGRRKVVFFLLLGSFLAIVLSGGEQLFLKSFLDRSLPAFRWFRFPSFFRLFFLIPAALLVGIGYEQLKTNVQFQKKQRIVFIIVLLVSIGLCLCKLYPLFPDLITITLNGSFWGIQTFREVIALSSFLWLICLLATISLRNKAMKYYGKIIIVDLLVMAIISLPIYSVGSYTVKEVKELLLSEGYSKTVSVDNSKGTYVDIKGNTFNNLNVYSNTVSSRDQYVGPLFLKSFEQVQQSDYAKTLSGTVIFAKNPNDNALKMVNDTFKDHTFSALVNSKQAGEVHLFQVWHPFWKAFIDNKEAPVHTSKDGYMYINSPSGVHNISFVFQDSYLNIFIYVFFICVILLLILIAILKLRGGNV